MTLARVSKHYRDTVALRAFDLDVADGEILVLVGPSGCGKTTVLRLIAGLENPDEGSVCFDGQDMAGVAPRDRNIAMVFEGYALYPHLAVRDNLAFALRLQHRPRAEISRRVDEVAAAMELGDLLERRPAGLATGEAQQVAIGRAVIRDTPAVVLLDDALSHLDAQQRLEARAEVGRLHHELGCTIVAVTHDQAEAMAIGGRVAVMDDGVLKQVGTPRQLYEHPADLFVAGFIGNPPMNLVRPEVFVGAGPEAPGLQRLRGRSVTVGVRPEDIRLVAPRNDAEAGFRGRCDLVEYLGSRLLVHVRAGASELVVLDDPSDDIRPGDSVVCSAPLERLRLFDSVTGRATEGPVDAGTGPGLAR